MKRCWLHIGMHKTGSTAIQRSFEKAALPPEWSYLTVGGSRNMGGALYAMFATHPHRYHWFMRRGQTPEEVTAAGQALRTELAETIRASGAENFIISGESLSLIDSDGILRLRDFLRNLQLDVQVLGYVRAPRAFKLSFFQQRLKHSDCPFDFSDFSPCYRNRFKKFDTLFGRANVLLKKFDPALLKDRCVVADFCECIGLKVPADFVVERANESLTREACGLLLAYRRFGPDYGIGEEAIKEQNQIVAPLIAMQGTRFKVAGHLLEPNARERDDLKWIEKRLGVSLREERESQGDEVSAEAELLDIPRSACVEFAARFAEYHRIPLSPDVIPGDDPVDPKAASEFIDSCRELWRERNRRKAVGRRLLVKKRPRLLTRCWKYLKKAPGRLAGSFSLT